MNQFSPYGIPSLQGATVEPPSFEPQIASLGQMIDTFTKRRIQMAQEEERNQAAQDEVDRKMAWDQEKEAYGRRKQDIAEKKVDQDAQYKRMVANQQEHKRAHVEIGAGRDPGTSIFFDETTGAPVKAQWRYQGGQPVPAPPPTPEAPPEPQAAPPPQPEQSPQGQPVPTMMGKPVMPPTVGQGPGRLPAPVASASPDGQVQAPNDQELEALMAKAQQPQEPQPQAPPPQQNPNTVFLDENDEGTTRALTQNDTQHQELPIEAFPPGAHEGQRFNAEDVNLTGGKGNPFAEPVPMPAQGGAQLSNERLENSPTSTSTFVPGRNIQGMSAQMPQPKVEQTASGKWVAVSEDGRIMGEVDPAQARSAHLDEVKQQVAAIDEQLTSGADPRLVPHLAGMKAALLAQLSPADRHQMLSQVSNEGMQDQRLAATSANLDKTLASKEKIAAETLDNRITIVKMKHKGGGATLGGIKIPQGDDGAFISIPTNNKGIPQPNNLLKEVTTDWRSWASDQGIQKQLLGLRRLALAENNIDANGPNSGVLNMEAAFNYLGFLRGGVPVQNETNEMIDHRRTWADKLHGLFARAGIGELIAKVEKGDHLTEEEANRARNVMSAEEQARIREGITESKRVMQVQVAQTLKPFVMKYADLNGPGAQILRQGAVSQANAELESVGLPNDFNPFNDTKLRGSGHLRSEGGSGSSTPAQTTPATQTQKPNAIDELAKQIKL